MHNETKYNSNITSKSKYITKRGERERETELEIGREGRRRKKEKLIREYMKDWRRGVEKDRVVNEKKRERRLVHVLR